MLEKDEMVSEIFTLEDFKFNNGEVLKEVDVEFMTLGTPRYDENGVIDNAAEFRQYLVEVGYATSIIAGEYDVPYQASYEEIYQILKAGPN